MTNQRDQIWATQTVPLGWPVMGIWAAGMPDGQTITAVDRSPCGRYVLTSDDLGAVRVLNYPAVVKHAPGLALHGHANFVTAARWSADASHVVSGGGIDRAVFHWKAELPQVMDAPSTVIGGRRGRERVAAERWKTITSDAENREREAERRRLADFAKLRDLEVRLARQQRMLAARNDESGSGFFFAIPRAARGRVAQVADGGSNSLVRRQGV